jgi:hypothetical protein
MTQHLLPKMISNSTHTPEWAIVAQNSAIAKVKYQHLVTSLRRRLQSAIEREDRALVRELECELALLEREL